MNAYEKRALVERCWKRRQSKGSATPNNIWNMKRHKAPEFVNFYLTSSIVQHNSWGANSSSSVKKFPEIYGTRKFITATSPCPELDEFILQRSILLLLLSLPSGFPTKPLCEFLLSPIRATCWTHSCLVDLK